MKEYFLRNYRIFLSIIFSFIFVFFIVPIFATPGRLTDLAKNFYSLLTLKFSLQNNNLSQNQTNPFNPPTVEPAQVLPNEPSVSSDVANGSSGSFEPTTGLMNQTPTSSNQVPTATQPTKTPKPTKPPDVFPIDPSLARPGTTTDEVFNIASQKTCVPVPVLKGIAYIESGSFFDVVSPKYFLLYNSANWWNSQYLTEEKRACGGYDYDNGSGLILSDSLFAGYNCHSDGSTGPQSYIYGPMQVNGIEQDQFGPKVASLLKVNNVDRRIILDAIMIVGLEANDNVKPTSCTNWTAWQVAKAACGYYGSCGFKDGTYYCNTFCRNYAKFGGKQNCQAAVNQMQDNCWQ
ncbi:hypothetical protein M1328_05510 [Patescibacteria group bacterium]|nr:hypothetical protein [Patescibacteria group bacterium]